MSVLPSYIIHGIRLGKKSQATLERNTMSHLRSSRNYTSAVNDNNGDESGDYANEDDA